MISDRRRTQKRAALPFILAPVFLNYAFLRPFIGFVLPHQPAARAWTDGVAFVTWLLLTLACLAYGVRKALGGSDGPSPRDE